VLIYNGSALVLPDVAVNVGGASALYVGVLEYVQLAIWCVCAYIHIYTYICIYMYAKGNVFPLQI